MKTLLANLRAVLRNWRKHYAPRLAAIEPETQYDFTASIARNATMLEARNNGGLK